MAQPKSVLITGVTGFVGSALARRLIAEGVRVCGVVRPGRAPEASFYLPGVKLIELDDVEIKTLTGILQMSQPDVVYNLAADGVQNGSGSTEAMLRCNVELPVNLAQAISGSGTALIQTGSCFEYAEAKDGKLLDERSPLQPFSLYGSTKAASALLLEGLAAKSGLNLIVLRLFGIYGPGEAPERLMPYLIRKLQRYEEVDLTEGTQQRDLLFIDDVVEALWTAGCCVARLQKDCLYNVCSSQAVSVREIALALVDELDRPAALLRWGQRPCRPGEPERIVGDHRLFCRATNWRPRVSLRDGLKRTIAHVCADSAIRQSA